MDTRRGEFIQAQDENETRESAERQTMSKKRKYVIVRCTQAGVHAGELVENKIPVVKLANARRLWRWWSSFTLSDLAMEGPRKDKLAENRYSMPVDEIVLGDACEVITCSPAGEKGIREAPNGNR